MRHVASWTAYIDYQDQVTVSADIRSASQLESVLVESLLVYGRSLRRLRARPLADIDVRLARDGFVELFAWWYIYHGPESYQCSGITCSAVMDDNGLNLLRFYRKCRVCGERARLCDRILEQLKRNDMWCTQRENYGALLAASTRMSLSRCRREYASIQAGVV